MGRRAQGALGLPSAPMQIKAADDKQPQIDAQTSLLSRPDVDAPTRKRIDEEIRNTRAGAKAEKDAAYEIEFHFGESRRTITLHDLRIECEGRVAQIDHLIISPFLHFWVCESKSVAGGISVNERGEWSTFFGSHARGIASPLEQNKKHVMVLDDVFSTGAVELPTRLRFQIKPTYHSVVLVSNSGRISRPKGRAAAGIENLDNVIKVDQLNALVDRTINAMKTTEVVKLVGPSKLAEFGRHLAALHRPVAVDWPSRFGLPPREHRLAPIVSLVSLEEPGRAVAEGGVHCSSCGKTLTAAEENYCVEYSARFAGKALCYKCQRAGRMGARESTPAS